MTGKGLRPADVAWGPSGLVPGIVQDAADGRVLMLAYVDAEALAATLATGEVHFHSRSRDRLWRKGETSGNVLSLVDVSLDCDGDALLLQVVPAGPTCHRGTRSCFDAADKGLAAAAVTEAAAPAPAPVQGFEWLEKLWSTIDARAGADPATSYTSRLLAGGVDASGRKVTEEATEVLMAAKDDAVSSPESRAATRDALIGEVADLVYHTLVLLRERDLPPAAVIARLRERHKG
jgi:phosphoribosyl-AMP cyclohydrolase / phosphoribosyl-ATP pyrophosphohydrolase